MDGSALVDGVLRIDSGDPAAALPEPPQGCLVGVDLGVAGFGHTRFCVFDRTDRRPDGFHAAGPPVLTVDLEEAVPDLRKLLMRVFAPEGVRQRIDVENGRLAMLSVRVQPADGGAPRSVFAHLQALDLGLRREDEGLRITLEGRISPFSPATGGGAISDARLVGDLVLPAAYCIIRDIGDRWRTSGDHEVGDWAPWGPGLGAVATDAFGSSYFRGTIDLEQDPGYRQRTSSFLRVSVKEHGCTVEPVGALRLLANGFADGRMQTNGPQLEIPLGYAHWARMIEAGDEGEIGLGGSGIGHLDGQTGRAVYEAGGPRRQELRTLRMRLRRTPEELRVEGDGELAPLPEGSTGPSLGPRLRFGFAVPRGWFFARGLRFPRFWEDWKREFPGADTW